jgi:ubiquinone/menaquinone biosynthesis C-methylase UbiE
MSDTEQVRAVSEPERSAVHVAAPLPAASLRDWFDRTALEWEDQYEDQGLRGRQVRRRMALALGYIEEERLAGEARILDLGCGPGILLSRVASLGFRTYGADFSPVLLSRARVRLSSPGAPAGCLVRADAHRLPFEDGVFNVVLCIGVLSWVSHPEAVQREIARVLSPGGVAILTARNLYCAENVFDPLFWWRRLAPTTVRRWFRKLIRPSRAQPAEPPAMCFSIRQLQQMLARGGLSTVRWRTVRFGPLVFLGCRVLPRSVELIADTVLERLWWLPPICYLGWLSCIKARLAGAVRTPPQSRTGDAAP